MKKHLLHIILALGAVLLVGCGGGGGTPVESIAQNENKIYENTKLPEINNRSIPDILLDDETSSSKMRKQFKEVGQISAGFQTLKDKAKFFYKKQLEMNIEVGYMDSIWNQVENYCQEKTSCDIPNEKIKFTYTEALYNRDVVLITEYEKKSGEVFKYDGFKQDLKSIIGVSIYLASAKLLIDNNTYTLITEENYDENGYQYMERYVAKWNDQNNEYFVKEEIVDNSGEIRSTQYEYRKTEEETINKFVSENDFWGPDIKILEFKEKNDGSIYFIQDEPNEDDLISYYAKGFLNDAGGEMTIAGAGETYYDRFDSNGVLISTAQCFGYVDEINEITNEDYCFIDDYTRIQNFLVEKRYFLLPNFDFNVILLPEDGRQSYVDFSSDNTLSATIDCYSIDASYIVNTEGVSFFNVNKVKDDTLPCHNSTIESIFVNFLNTGIDWSNGSDPGYNPVYDLDYYGLGQL